MLWSEASERLKSQANRARDVVELYLDSDDPKTELGAAKCVLQEHQALG